MTKYYPGSTPYLEWEYWKDNVLADPDTSFTCTIYDAKGKAVDSDKALTKDSTGIYYYAGYTIPSTPTAAGKYRAIAKFTDGGIVKCDDECLIEFEVEKASM